MSSRLVRANPELRAVISELSVVAPATGGLPVAYGVSEALRTRKVYWAEREDGGEALRFRQFLQIEPKEKVLLVDDEEIVRTATADMLRDLGYEVVEMPSAIQALSAIRSGISARM